MKAILSIEFKEYLIADAKKALALVELLNSSKIIKRSLGYEPDRIQLTDEAPRVEMKIVPSGVTIVPAKSEEKKTTSKPNRRLD